jgi:hypothetical protein
MVSMSQLIGFGFRWPGLSRSSDRTELVQLQRPLRRILAFTGHSIDDVVNDPIARNQVRLYYKLHRHVERASEVVDLERWWNGDSWI